MRSAGRPVAAVIVAGGVGRRLKARVHKPFIRLAGRPMLARTLQAFECSPSVGSVVLVAHADDLAQARVLVRRYLCRKVAQVVPGGRSRMESVGCGLRALPAFVLWVAVHDAARPLVTPQIIEAAVKEARRSRAAVVAVPVVPTLKEGRNGRIVRTIDRRKLWAAQTPQVFERSLLERAHARGRADGLTATDDAALVEHLGVKVHIVRGDDRNIKVTTPEDRIIAEALLKHANRHRV